jgi:hypothetical protein
MLCLHAYAIPYIVVDSAVRRYPCIIDTLTDTLTLRIKPPITHAREPI